MSATDADSRVVAPPIDTTVESTPRKASRFEYIDGLRGVAATMVAVGHLAGAAEAKNPGILGHGVMQLAEYGRYGVQIFFVLSGFVIAHSVINGAYSFGYLARFIGRRFVRLDLPYWSIIAMEIVLLGLSGMVMTQYARELPSIPQILANAFYLQQYLGYDHILPVFWTLCYEVQFYLVFVTSLVLLTKLREAGLSSQATRRLAWGALAVSFCWSLSMYVELTSHLHRGLFLDRWYQFALGVLTYLYYRGLCSWRPVVAALVLCIVAGTLFGLDDYRVTSTLLTAGTSMAILLSLRSRWWNSLLIGPVAQFLGRTSYSLYLIHNMVGWRAVVVTRELLGGSYNTATAYLAFSVGLSASIFGAWVMYRVIELPAIQLARRIPLPQRSAPALSAH